MHADRGLVKKRTHKHLQLEGRDPALITLPIPIPSIPIIEPLLTKLIAGEPFSDITFPTLIPNHPKTTSTTSIPSAAATPTSTPATAPLPNSQPAQPPSPSPSQAQDQPGSDPSSAQSSNGDSGSDGGSGSGSSGNGSSGSGENNGDNGNAGSDGDNGNSGANSGHEGSGDSNSSGNGSSLGGASESSQPSTNTPSAAPPLSSSSVSQVSANSQDGTNASMSVSSFTTGADGKPTPLVGADSDATHPASDGSSLSLKSAVQALASPSPSPNFPVSLGEASTSSGTLSAVSSVQTAASSQNGANSNNGGPNDGGNSSPGSPTGTSGSTSSDSGHHSVPAAVIAVIAVFAALLLIGFIVFAFRRCFKAKRLSRRGHWFRSHSVYGAAGISSSGYFRQRASSVRSSFGTSYEHQPIPASPPPIPTSSGWSSLSLMSQESNHPVSFSVASKAPSSSSPSFHDASEMESLNTAPRLSAHADFDDVPSLPQIFPVHAHGAETKDKMSHSRPGTPISVRPFSPTERWSFPKPPSGQLRESALYPVISPTPSPTSDSMATSDYITAEDSGNPFADPHPDESVDMHTTESLTSIDTTNVHFLPIETVHRPFVPTRGDEIAVASGDTVHVIKRYDDGWAYAENRVSKHRGLFPIDCLRMADQDLPAFLAAKRLSSYGAKLSTHRIPPS